MQRFNVNQNHPNSTLFESWREGHVGVQVRRRLHRDDQNRLGDSARGTCALFLFAPVEDQRWSATRHTAPVRDARSGVRDPGGGNAALKRTGYLNRLSAHMLALQYECW